VTWLLRVLARESADAHAVTAPARFRTMALFATLTIMPIFRVGLWFLRLFGRGDA
jgi:hypothetical protein